MNTSLICKIALVLVLSAPLHAFGELLEYKCEIPEGLDQKITLIGKDGREKIADAHLIYRKYHKAGWLNFVRLHMAKGSLPLLEMEREDIQEWGIMTDSRRIGSLEAQAMLSKAELVYEAEKLDKMVDQLLRKEQGSEAVAVQPATAPESKSKGKDKPQPDAKPTPR